MENTPFPRPWPRPASGRSADPAPAPPAPPGAGHAADRPPAPQRPGDRDPALDYQAGGYQGDGSSHSPPDPAAAAAAAAAAKLAEEKAAAEAAEAEFKAISETPTDFERHTGVEMSPLARHAVARFDPAETIQQPAEFWVFRDREIAEYGYF